MDEGFVAGGAGGLGTPYRGYSKLRTGTALGSYSMPMLRRTFLGAVRVLDFE